MSFSNARCRSFCWQRWDAVAFNSSFSWSHQAAMRLTLAKDHHRTSVNQSSRRVDHRKLGWQHTKRATNCKCLTCHRQRTKQATRSHCSVNSIWNSETVWRFCTVTTFIMADILWRIFFIGHFFLLGEVRQASSKYCIWCCLRYRISVEPATWSRMNKTGDKHTLRVN